MVILKAGSTVVSFYFWIRGGYVFKSKRKLQWSLPLKSPGDIHLDPSGVKGNSRIRGVYVFKRKRKLQWNRPFKITMRYSLGTHRGQRKFSRKGVYVSKSKKNLQCSLPLKSPGDILLDTAGVKGNSRVRVYVFKSQR